MTIFTNESLSVYPQRLNTNRGNGYLQPFAIGSFFPTTQAEIFPDHDCDNTSSFPNGGSVTGGLGNGQVTRSPASSPPQSESGQFPLSSLTPPLAPNFINPDPAPNSNATPLPPGGPSAFAACTIAPDFPAVFGGGKIPEVRPDPDRFPAWPTSRTPRTSTTRSASCSRSWPSTTSWRRSSARRTRSSSTQHRDPDSTITVRLKEDEPSDVEFGETEMEPEVVMSMEADTAHLFWLGRVNVTTALARGQIKASGPVAKILKLVPLTKPVFPRYKAQLEDMGRDDLVDVD